VVGVGQTLRGDVAVRRVGGGKSMLNLSLTYVQIEVSA
jgi:hypothetical protein